MMKTLRQQFCNPCLKCFLSWIDQHGEMLFTEEDRKCLTATHCPWIQYIHEWHG
jgi:hypothetical protein